LITTRVMITRKRAEGILGEGPGGYFCVVFDA
jgi:hypothetical protein